MTELTIALLLLGKFAFFFCLGIFIHRLLLEVYNKLRNL